MQTENKHIAIVGAGLVGSLLSVYLIKRGYQVTVFERRANMRTHVLDGGRSINLALSNRGIRALEHVGLAESMKKVAIPMHGRMMHNTRGELTFQSYGKNGQFINSVSRSGLNKMLMDEAEKLGVHFFYEYRCEDIDFEKTEVKFQTYGSHMTRKFDLIIGADGAFSAVREAMEKKAGVKTTIDTLEHGYKELRIPSSDSGAFQLQKNALHIWPRASFMLIALPNPDATFTCTLFLPFEGEQSFKNLKSKESILQFFKTYFPDTIPLMDTLVEDFRDNATSSLVTVRCYPWVKNNVVLIGDAAHGIVPFYGQGMNAGFEDCFVLNALLDKHKDDWADTLSAFQELRKPDNDAIAQLALDNFVEMRDLVADEDFLLRKKIEAKLHDLFPNEWIPLYSMVTFEETMRYSEAMENGVLQHQVMMEVMKDPDIKTNWERLDFKSIVDKLTALRAN
ncbi:MAG TPA: kynurenine 3-monooxygenase [Cytophagales bacterium]|nr:kynurenine 3-monooxygenase [Cytophagales bacterium]HCR54232.1 kynurenine 3-monooxygenase [Cytophagales bacterium]